MWCYSSGVRKQEYSKLLGSYVLIIMIIGFHFDVCFFFKKKKTLQPIFIFRFPSNGQRFRVIFFVKKKLQLELIGWPVNQFKIQNNIIQIEAVNFKMLLESSHIRSADNSKWYWWMNFKALVGDHGLPKAAAFDVFQF